MATTTNYGWTTPDDTALVKDGAAAIRTLGSSVDTTTKALNPSTTLGDIEYRSSTANTNTRLGIGSAGQVLTVTSGVPAWETVTGAPNNFTLLNAGGTALTGAATITISGITAKNNITILFTGMSSNTGSSNFKVRINTDTGNNYYPFGGELELAASAGQYPFQQLGTASDGIPIGTAVSFGANDVISGGITLNGCNSSGKKMFIANANYGANGGSAGLYGRSVWTQGYYDSASTVSSVSLFSSAGNFDAGTVYVYASA